MVALSPLAAPTWIPLSDEDRKRRTSKSRAEKGSA
jgi:hypothetical protein